MEIAVIALIIIAFLLAFCLFLMIRNRRDNSDRDKDKDEDIRENFPQSSPMNVMYSDANGNLATTNDLGLKYLTISSDGALVLDGSGSGSGNVKDQLADLYAKIRELSATIASNKTAADNSIANLRSDLSTTNSTISAHKTAADNGISSVRSDLNASIDTKTNNLSTKITSAENTLNTDTVRYSHNIRLFNDAHSAQLYACGVNQGGGACSNMIYANFYRDLNAINDASKMRLVKV
jgi:uncharacterized protein YpmS